MAKKTIYLSGTNAISPRKRNFYKILGFLLIVFSGYQIYTYLMKQVPIEFSQELILEFVLNFSFMNSFILFCISIGFLFTGFQLVGRKTNQYIRFENNKIIYKPSFLKDSKSVDIDNLKEIVFSPTWVLCISDKEKFMIDLSWVSVYISANIKNIIGKIAAEKQIKVKGS